VPSLETRGLIGEVIRMVTEESAIVVIAAQFLHKKDLRTTSSEKPLSGPFGM
jgi:hypothetical protein